MQPGRQNPVRWEGEVYTTEEPRVIDDAITTIQEHLDREARNRRLSTQEPQDLCPMQKARLVDDLADVLDAPGGRRSLVRTFQHLVATLIEGFRARL